MISLIVQFDVGSHETNNKRASGVIFTFVKSKECMHKQEESTSWIPIKTGAIVGKPKKQGNI